MGQLKTKTQAVGDTPPVDYLNLYPKPDGCWYTKDENGVERKVLLSNIPFKTINSANYLVDALDQNLKLDGSANNVILQMPDPALNEGKQYYITASDVTNNVRVNQSDGSTKIFRFRNIKDAIKLMSDGDLWKIF